MAKTGLTLNCPAKNKPFSSWFFAIIVLLLSSCSANKGESSKAIFAFNESNGLSSLDPAYAKDLANLNVCNQLYNGLVQLDSNLQIKPAIARSWTVSPDGKTYRFVLRKDVFFHDNEAFENGKGRSVSAEDVVYSFNRIVNPKTVSPGAWVFNLVDKEFGFQAVNDTIVEIHLQKAFGPFLSLLSMQYCSIIPKEAVEYYGADFRKHPVGTGPFRFKFWEEEVKLVLERNPNYFEATESEPIPYLDAVNIGFLVDKQAEFLEFVLQNIDYLSGIEAGFKDEILTSEGELQPKYQQQIRLQKQAYLNTEYIGILNDQSMPEVKQSPLNNLKFRQAIQYAIDKEKMLRYLLNNIGTPGSRGMLPTAYPMKNVQYGYTYNPAKAELLLKEAKVEMGMQTLEPIKLVATAKSMDIVKFVQHQLQEIGIPVEIELMQWAALKEVVAQSKALFFRGSWIADYPDPENYMSLFYSANFSPSGPNYTHFSNPTFDSLYNYAIFASDPNVKSALYRKMDSLVMEEAVVIPLFYDEVLRFTQKSVEGLPMNPMNLLDLKRVRKK